MLVQQFATQRDPSRAPLVQVLMVMEPPLDPLPEGWAFTHMDVETGTAKFDLQLGLDERAEGLTGRFIYNTDLFERETIELLKARWLQLLDRVVAAPRTRIEELTADLWQEGGSDSQRQMPLVEWNGTRTEYPRDATINELFEKQVRQSPSAIAIVSGDEQLTYEELNRRSNQLARRLRELGVKRDVPVGVSMERSAQLIVALLAVLKAGGVYVPIDPAYPAERRALLMKDTGIFRNSDQRGRSNCKRQLRGYRSHRRRRRGRFGLHNVYLRFDGFAQGRRRTPSRGGPPREGNRLRFFFRRNLSPTRSHLFRRLDF